MIAALAAKAWAALLPWAGPLLLKLMPLAAWLPAGAALKRGLRVASYAGVLVCGMWLGAKALGWWQGDLLSEHQAKARAAEAIARAHLAAREAALTQRERHIKDREAQIEADALEIAKLEMELTDDRTITPADSAPALVADDEWLRKWRERR